MKLLSETLTKHGIAFSFPIQIEDANGNQTYYEDRDGFWSRREYDANGNQTYYECSAGYWRKWEYDTNGKETYYENSDGKKDGTPRSQPSDGKVIEVDGKKYKLTAL
jgi:hypothetical protein